MSQQKGGYQPIWAIATKTKPSDRKKPAASSSTSNAPPPPMPCPIPPNVLLKAARSQTTVEDLSAMLMSWYMCGYHTGYYQGVQDGKCRKE